MLKIIKVINIKILFICELTIPSLSSLINVLLINKFLQLCNIILLGIEVPFAGCVKCGLVI